MIIGHDVKRYHHESGDHVKIQKQAREGSRTCVISCSQKWETDIFYKYIFGKYI